MTVTDKHQRLAAVEAELARGYAAIDAIEHELARQCRPGEALRVEQYVHEEVERRGLVELEVERARLRAELGSQLAS